MRQRRQANRQGARRLARRFGVAVLLATVAAPNLRGDRVVLADGRDLGSDVSIVSATWEEVELRIGRRRQQLPAAQVRELARDSEALAPTRRRFTLAKYQEVLVDVRDFDKDFKNASGWEKAEAAYLLGETHLKMGKLEEARAAYEAYLAAYKEAKDWWVPFATHRLVEIAMSERKPGSAATLGAELARFGGRWEVIGKFAQAKALLETKKLGEAESVLNDVVRLASDPELKQAARVYRIEASVIAGNHSQAIKDLDANFFATGASDLLYGYARGRATLLMGQSYAALGGEENDARAEMWLQETVALYGQHADLLAAACDELAKLYKKQDKAQRAAFWEKRRPAQG